MLGETTLIIGFAIDEHQGIFSHEKTDDGDWRYIYRVEKEKYRGYKQIFFIYQLILEFQEYNFMFF